MKLSLVDQTDVAWGSIGASWRVRRQGRMGVRSQTKEGDRHFLLQKAAQRLQKRLRRGRQQDESGCDPANFLRQERRFLVRKGRWLPASGPLEKEKLNGMPSVRPTPGLAPQGMGLQIVTGDEEYGFFLWCCHGVMSFTLKI